MAGGHDLAVDLDQLDHARLERRPARAAARRRPWRRWPKRKFSPTLTCSRAERADEHVVDELLRRLRAANAPSNGMTTSSSTPSPATRSALVSSEVSSFGAASGATTARGCGSKVSTVSAPRDHLAVAEVHAVELADRHAARARLGVGEPGDVHQPRKPTTGLSVPSARGSASAISPSSSTQPGGARRRGPATATPCAARRAASPSQLDGGQEAQRVVERDEAPRRPRRRTGRSASAAARGSRRRRGRRSASARRSPRRTRSRSSARSPSRQRCSNAVHVDLALGHLDGLPRRARARTPARPPTLTAE